ncbi:permease [Robiginitalea sp. SC105]|uniref:permease n=1 Tax=Robiginitalea sp. SC105 TaxID=2762332 RepID=UPI001639A66D|nr:permease [Robiginitalea sp. SC105]MBC2838558.1 permease [Robiginitalea sp. SC105]
MDPALQRTLELLLIIGIGLLLQRKLGNRMQLDGLKIIILNVALPATIFLALLKVELKPGLLVLPCLALAFNLLMFLAVRFVLPWFAPGEKGPQRRTLAMLLPSLAPGLSCYPFIMAYLDDASLAMAALADVGNKFFGLILLYLLAMHWYNLRSPAATAKAPASKKLRGLFLSLLREPINLVIGAAIILLIAGLNLESLPGFIAATVNRFSVMMVALVLLFIGMAVRVSLSDLRTIALLLSWRSGMALLFSSLMLFLLPALSPALILLVIVFPQSSCSFWPYAHMHLVNTREESESRQGRTFDTGFAVNLLACSLPFSSGIILLAFNFPETIAHAWVLALVGFTLVGISLLPRVWQAALRKLRSAVPENVFP